MSDQLLVDFELLAKLFKDGGWSELRVKSGDVSLLLSKEGNASLIDENERRPEAAPSAKTDSAKSVQSTTRQMPANESTPAQGVSIDASWKAVAAPNIGTFYRSPKPGSAPFVEVGQHVTAQTEICLLEVMKLFTSVNSGIDGTVVQICAIDAELVEGGQILFYIQPD